MAHDLKITNSRWLMVPVLGFVLAVAMMLISLPPLRGEDEANHFGHIWRRSITSNWYLFDTNTKPVSLQIFRSLTIDNGIAPYSSYAPYLSMDLYDQIDSLHVNATAYQPPLYYELGGRIVALFDFSLTQASYYFRVLSLFFGVVSIYFMYKLLQLFDINHAYIYLALLTFGWIPVGLLLFATISVQPLIIMLFSWFWYEFFNVFKNKTYWRYVIGGAVLVGITLFSQQIGVLMAVYYLIGLTFVYMQKQDMQHIIAGLLFVSLLALPGIWYFQRLSLNVSYFGNIDAVQMKSIWGYIFKELPRIGSELWDGFSRQQRGGILMYAPQWLSHTYSFWVLIGLISGAWLMRSRRFVLIMLLFIGGLFCFHLVVDYLQYQQAGIQYFKARYMLPGLSIFSLLWALGVRKLVPNQLQMVVRLGTIGMSLLLVMSLTTFIMGSAL